MAFLIIFFGGSADAVTYCSEADIRRNLQVAADLKAMLECQTDEVGSSCERRGFTLTQVASQNLLSLLNTSAAVADRINIQYYQRRTMQQALGAYAARAAGRQIMGRTLHVLGSNAAFGAIMLFSHTATGCGADRIPSPSYINLNRDCNLVYEINQSVVRYLELPPARQAELLREGYVPCGYYERLKDKFFPPLRFHSLECRDGSFKVDLTENDKRYTGVFNLNPSNRHVRFTDQGSWFRGHLGYITHRDRIYTHDVDSERYMMSARRYFTTAKACCENRRDAAVWRACARTFSPANFRNEREQRRQPPSRTAVAPRRGT